MLKYVGEGSVSIGSFEGGGSELKGRGWKGKGQFHISRRREESSSTHDHLVNQDTERPPIHSRRVTSSLDDFGSDVLCGRRRIDASGLSHRRGIEEDEKRRRTFSPDEGVCPEVSDARTSIDDGHLRGKKKGQVRRGRRKRSRKRRERTPVDALVRIRAGAPPGSPDCLERSKSESMM